MWDDTEIFGLVDCPRSSLRWAALAYRAGHRDGREDLLRDLGQAGEAAARLARPTLARPSWGDILRRRDTDFTACPTKCRRCSRCIASEAYWGRGGRDFLGVEAEAALAVAS